MEEEYEELQEIEIGENYEEDETSNTLSLFDIVNDMSQKGKLVESFLETNKKMPGSYLPYMINNAFSHFSDCIFLVNEMNKFHFIPSEAQWRFYNGVLPKFKRRSDWFKPKKDDTIELLAKYFECSVPEIKKNIKVIPKNQLKELIKELTKDVTPTKNNSK